MVDLEPLARYISDDKGIYIQDVLTVLEAAGVDKIMEFHRASTDHGQAFSPYCVGCWEEGGMDGAPTWPCKTVQAIHAGLTQ